MRLHLESVQHLREELRGRKREPPVKQTLGDHSLAADWGGKWLVSNKPPSKLLLDVSLGLKILHVGVLQSARPPFAFGRVGGAGIFFFVSALLLFDSFRLSLFPLF